MIPKHIAIPWLIYYSCGHTRVDMKTFIKNVYQNSYSGEGGKQFTKWKIECVTPINY